MALSPPLAGTWGDVVNALVAERGSLAELARALHERMSGPAVDLATIERGLRRLRQREHEPADKYGRLVLRHLGLPSRLADWARALGTYHGPLIDLPLSLRRDQLRQWDRPPFLEADEASWIHLAVASLRHHDGDPAAADRRLELARLGLARSGPAAAVEWGLFAARRAMDLGDGERCEALLTEVGAALEDVSEPTDRACYEARWLDQRSYATTRTWRTEPDRLERGGAFLAQIPESGPPFARYRRHHGLAWIRWRQGQCDAAERHAREALTIAGDAGLVRLRAATLRLLACFADPAEAGSLRARAQAMLTRLDEAP